MYIYEYKYNTRINGFQNHERSDTGGGSGGRSPPGNGGVRGGEAPPRTGMGGSGLELYLTL
jgi:hypothetical protein